MHFSKSLQGSKQLCNNKSETTMRPVSIESTLLLFLPISNFLGKDFIIDLRHILSMRMLIILCS